MSVASTAFSVSKYGQGEPMLLIPGLNSSGELWEDTVDAFSNRYECHVFTLAGFAGQPSVNVDNYTKFIVEEIANYIDRQSLTLPILVGHSLGGFVSMWVGLLLKEKIKQIVVIDITPFLPAIFNPNASESNTLALAKGMRKHMEDQSPEQARYAQEKLLLGMTNSEADFEKALQWGLNSDQDLAAQVMYELYTIDLRDKIQEVACPVLVLGSWRMFENYGLDKDQIVTIFGQQYENIGNVKVEIFDEAKHYIMWDERKKYIGLLEEFFKNHQAAK